MRALFPDAIFVVIRGAIPATGSSSLINGWRHQEGRYRAYYVPAELQIPGYNHKYRWCFTLIEGWRNYISSPIPEIAFAQWEQYVKAIAAAREVVPSSNWIEIYMEELLARPEETLAGICEKIGIQKTPQLVAKLAQLVAQPVNALSAPVQDKWRRDNEQEIIALLPRIAARSPALGYNVDPETGNCTISAVTKNTVFSKHFPNIVSPAQARSERQPVFNNVR